VSDLSEGKGDQLTSARGRFAKPERSSNSNETSRASQSPVVSTAGFGVLLAGCNNHRPSHNAASARRRSASSTSEAHVTSLGQVRQLAALGVTPSQHHLADCGAKGLKRQQARPRVHGRPWTGPGPSCLSRLRSAADFSSGSVRIPGRLGSTCCFLPSNPSIF
jgi:hypothetical protein